MIALIDGDLIDLIGTFWINKSGYAVHKKDTLVHRTVAEHALGRKLQGTERVHHIDYNKLNNQRSNLVICPDDSYHFLLHARQDCLNDGFSPDTHRFCTYHKQYELKEEFSFAKSWDGRHNMCRKATNESRQRTGVNIKTFGWREKLDQQFRRAVVRGTCSKL